MTDYMQRGESGKVHVVGRVSRWGLRYRLCDGEHLPADEYNQTTGPATCVNCLAALARAKHDKEVARVR